MIWFVPCFGNTCPKQGTAGGCVGGEIAAHHVIDAFRNSDFSKDHLGNDLADALSKAEKQISQNVKRNPDLYGMGSTATTAAVYQKRVAWIHVGDSRMYLLHDNKIKQITRDHTFLQDFIDDGTLTPEQAKIHPFILGPQAFYGCLGGMLSSVAVFAIWRSTQRTEIEIEEQGDFVVMATTNPLTASLNPDVDLAEIEAAVDIDEPVELGAL